MAHQDPWFQYEDQMKNNDHQYHEPSSSSSIGEESTVSNGSSSSSSLADTTDDASSSSTSSSFNSNGSLYDLSEVMAQLPIKRGLSKFYQGKSESFTSLSKVTSLEDLAKKASPYRKNMKASKSYGNGLNSYKNYTLPKAIISKKATKGSFLSSFPSRRGSFMNKNLECYRK